jgi:hypothetical protein
MTILIAFERSVEKWVARMRQGLRISDKILEKIATALEKQWKNWPSGRRKDKNSLICTPE